MKSFIKQNLFIVIMVGVTVLALTGALFPMLEVSKAREQGDQIASLDISVQDALHNPESPQWVLESQQGIDNIKKIQEEVIGKALRKCTRQPLFVKDRQGKDHLVLPDPMLAEDDGVPLRTFQQFYSASFAEWLKLLGAGSPPSADEITKATDERRKTIENSVSDAILKVKLAMVPAELLVRRARESSIWADANCFDNYMGRLDTTKAITPIQVWEAMLNWWVQKDVVEVIADTNSSAAGANNPGNVMINPVKELAYIQVGQYVMPKSGAGAAPPASLTGRETNARYDVLLFKFQVVMDPRKLPLLVGKLSAKNFHTVLWTRYETLEKKGGGREQAAGGGGASAPPPPAMTTGSSGSAGGTSFEYGGDPVMLVTFQCEAVFMKSPASWRVNPEEARRKRLDFLCPVRPSEATPDNRDLILEVHSVSPTGQRTVVLKHDELVAKRAELNKLLLQARLKLEAGKDRDAVAKMVTLLNTDERFKDIKPLATDQRALDDLAKQDLEFIALYEDLVPNDIRDKYKAMELPHLVTARSGR